MVSVSEATSIVLDNLYKPFITTLPIADAVNHVLAEIISADRDLPPIDRVTMDGIAINFATWHKGQKQFSIEGIQAAGTPRKRLRDILNGVEVMTGAPLPSDTDTVIPYEEIEINNGIANIISDQVVKAQNVHKQGSDASRDQHLLAIGMVLSPAEIAVLASIGKPSVKVYSFPKTAIISSGDELVPIEASPEVHQVRRSNSYAIQAAMKAMGWQATMYHLADNKTEMISSLHKIAEEYEVIILSGGVSKGKFDFVPEVLEHIGIQKLFHRVNQRPGKPFWFGHSSRGNTVFALPGNPVSTYMCFYRYIKPWILKSLTARNSIINAILASDFVPPKGMTYFLQVVVDIEEGKLIAYPDAGGGSGDFANLNKVSGFLELPEGRNVCVKGEIFPYYPFRSI